MEEVVLVCGETILTNFGRLSLLKQDTFLLTSAKQLNLNPQNYKNIFFYFLIYFFFVICVFRSGGSKWVRSENFFSGIQNHYFGAELNPGDQTGFTTLLFLIFYLRLIKILYDF